VVWRRRELELKRMPGGGIYRLYGGQLGVKRADNGSDNVA